MERILEYEISKEDAGRTIKDFLQEKGFSGQNIVELKKMKESILLNGVWEYVTCKVKEDDVLRIHICEEGSSEKIPPVYHPLDIIYEDEDIMVINKAADMPIHPSMNNYYNSLANALAYYFEQQGKPFIFRCSNRLDRDTSGLTIISKHLVSANILAQQVADRQVHREYLAISRGSVTPKEGTIDVPLGRKDSSIIERTVDWEHGERAVTHYKVVGESNGHSLISLQLETGRTHQIRIHMKHIGYPLIGDYLYNPDMEWITRQALHSHKMVFFHPITGEKMEFTAPLPADMQRVLDGDLEK